MAEEFDTAKPRAVTRWETDCCSFLFNLSGPGALSLPTELTTVHVYGEGPFLAGRCPGCDHNQPSLTQVGGDDDD